MDTTGIVNNLVELVKSLNKDIFIYDFLLAYGISKTSVTRLQKGDFNLSKIPGEVLAKENK